jgi:hypothetical protein
VRISASSVAVYLFASELLHLKLPMSDAALFIAQYISKHTYMLLTVYLPNRVFFVYALQYAALLLKQLATCMITTNAGSAMLHSLHTRE